MNPLLMRILSGAILVAVMTAMILFSVDTLLILALVLAAVTIPEFFRLVFPQDKGVTGLIQHFNTILVSWLMIFTTYLVVWTAASARWYLILLPVVFSLMALNMFNKRDGSPVRRIGTQITVLVYIGIPLSLLVGLGADRNEMGVMAYNSRLVLFYFILIWVNDIGAYLVGMNFGRHRLFERLSPKKSWEGFFGGLFCTVWVSFLLGPGMTGWENISAGRWVVLGVVLTLSAVGGDLFESMLKREAGVKNSGHALPGHGGFLDRFDALFLSLPFVYIFIRLMG